MATLKERKINGLVEAGIGLEQRDKERALKGINEFIQCSLLEMELDRLADEAEEWDRYYHYEEPESVS